jgi:hypothetical protein
MGFDCLPLRILYESRFEVIVFDGLEVFIELVHQRHAVGDVELNDVGIRDVVQVLDEGSDGVAMGHNEGLFASEQSWGY